MRDDGDILHRHSLVPTLTRHLLILENARGVRVRTDRATVSEILVNTVCRLGPSVRLWQGKLLAGVLRRQASGAHRGGEFRECLGSVSASVTLRVS